MRYQPSYYSLRKSQLLHIHQCFKVCTLLQPLSRPPLNIPESAWLCIIDEDALRVIAVSVLRIGKFRRPEATTSASRRLETASGPASPPCLERSRSQSDIEVETEEDGKGGEDQSRRIAQSLGSGRCWRGGVGR